MAGGATGTSGGAPYEATKRVGGVPTWDARTHAGGTMGAFCGAPLGPRNVPRVCRNLLAHEGPEKAPYGATKRVRDVQKFAVRTQTGGATVACDGALMWQGNVRGVCRRWWRGRMRAAPLGLSRWSSDAAARRVRGVPTLEARAHAGGAIDAFGGAPMGP